jgi:predicted Zn-dependent protease
VAPPRARVKAIAERFCELAPSGVDWSLRVVRETSEELTVRKDVVEPPRATQDLGAMVTVAEGDGLGYAATSDLSDRGLATAAAAAHEWAKRTAGRSVAGIGTSVTFEARGEYDSPVRIGWETMSLRAKLELLRERLRLVCSRIAGTQNPRGIRPARLNDQKVRKKQPLRIRKQE